MDPNKVFSEVISFVENSQLNYCIHRKTPFSAIISVKSSLINRIKTGLAEDTIKTESNDTNVESLKEENVKLRRKLNKVGEELNEAEVLKTSVKALITEKTRLENLQKKDKVELKHLETQTADFRSELLQLKSDKNNILQKSKVQEKELSKLSEEITKLKETNKSYNKELKQSAIIVASKEKDLEKVNKEKQEFKDSLEKVFTEQQKLMNEKKKEIIDLKFSCRICEHIFDTKVELSDHVIEEHQQVKETQTLNSILREMSLQTESCVKAVKSENKPLVKSETVPTNLTSNLFEKYECFYCKATITNKIFLDYHRTNCHVKFENIMHSFDKLSEALKLPCNKCKQMFRSKEDLEQHDALYHNILTAVGFPNWRGWTGL